MSVLDTAMIRLESLIDRKIRRVTPFRAHIDDLADGLATLKRLDAVTVETEPRAMLAGSMLVVGDEVICLNIDGKPFVLGRVQRKPEADTIVPLERVVPTQASTSNNATMSTTETRTITVQPGAYRFAVIVAGTMSRSVATGGVVLGVEIETDATPTASTPSTASYSGGSVEMRNGLSGTIMTTSGTIVLRLLMRGDTTSGTTYLDRRAWYGLIARISEANI